MQLKAGWLTGVRRVASPHYNDRPPESVPSLLVIHNISLPPGCFGGPWIDALFTGTLDAAAHPFFSSIAGLRVSAHCLIRRDGEIVQYVPFHQRAWHAGISCYHGQSDCNDFSVGIELEGTDTCPYTTAQYQALVRVSQALFTVYPEMASHIVGHSDIAPGRKSDPGHSFDWIRYLTTLAEASSLLSDEESS
ncbi:MAG: 1,6-anhydro-N-acetylmuramyl-L-alanine amidase AmpD [Candidatus Erwinia impunctatus]|nr:1,6-anhydro-N-acetylmuramyl-L-alanine amidase AmpD [Culicoides impunctatus]